VSNRNVDKLPKYTKAEYGDGIFVFDSANARDNQVISRFAPSERALLKRFFKNSDIRRYWCSSRAEKYLLYIGRDLRSLRGYPNVAAHLNTYKAILSDRREVENGRIEFFQLQWPRAEHIFVGPKLVVPYRSERNTFAYDASEWFCRSDCYVITQKSTAYDLRYLLALLNSKLYYLWLYHRGKRKGEVLELFQVPLSEIPVRRIPMHQQQPYIRVADAITEAKKHDPEEDTEGLEHEIDLLVYELYGLTLEEVSLIEAAVTVK
jgi:adenine-specific DNA-methyltransferase